MNWLAISTFIGATAAVAIATTLIVRRMKRSDNATVEYFTGGRALAWPVVAGSLMLTNLSTEQLVGLNGDIFLDGNLAGIAWEVGAAIAMVMTALFFLPRYLRNGFTTTPGYLALRFDKTTRQVVSGLFLFGYAVTFLPVVLYTGAKAIGGIFGLELDLWVIVAVVGLLGSLYAVVGGLKSVAVSDTLNGIGLLVGGLAIPFLALQVVGDGSALAGLGEIWTKNPESFSPLGTAENSVPWPTLLTGMIIVNVFYWSTNQVIVQRALGAESLEAGQKGILFAAGLKLLGPLMLCVPGLVALHLVSEGAMSIPQTCGANGTSLCSAEVYPTLVGHVLPGWALGLFAAVLVGAVLSSFNSGLNSAATLFSLQFYREYVRKDASAEELVSAGRKFGIGLTLVTVAIAPMLDQWTSIFEYLQVTNGLYSVPIITVFAVGMLSKRVPPLGAKLGMAAGGGLYAAFVLADKLMGVSLTGGLHWLHNLAIAFFVGVVAMLVVGHFKPLNRATYDARLGTADAPVSVVAWKSAGTVSSFILGGVVIIYGALTFFAFGL